MGQSAEEKLYDEVWKNKVVREAADLTADGSLRRNAALPLLGRGVRLLDLGCGEGTLAAFVRDRFQEVHGVDISEEAVQRARAAGVVARRVNINTEPLPYDEGYFDAVVSLDVIEHVFDPVRFLQEVHRILRPGGALVISTPNIRKLQRIFSLIRGHFPRTSYDPVGYDGGHLHYFTSRDMKALLEQQGFAVEHVGGICGDRRTWKYRLAVGLLGSRFEQEWLSSAVILRGVKHGEKP